MSEPKLRNISELSLLDRNPRSITDESFEKLCESIRNNPDYFEARPIILSDRTGRLVVIAGNQRLKAAKEVGLIKVPTFLLSGLTEEREKEIIIRDNVSNGEWDFEILNVDFDDQDLESWGVEFSIEYEKPEDEAPVTSQRWIPDCLFPSNNIFDIPTLREDMAAERLDVPVRPYGAQSRAETKGVGTYHFYVDDYRFQKIWDQPLSVVDSGATAIIEPNLSLFNEMPVSYGLHLIYKKRWIARFWQDHGIRCFVDLNVPVKFYEYNLLGVPDGWNAFATRGNGDAPEFLLTALEMARQKSKKKEPYFVVYGGGKEVKKIAADNNCIYIEQMMQEKFKK